MSHRKTIALALCLVAALTIAAACSPSPPARPILTSTIESTVDREWLQAQVEQVFQINRSEVRRHWEGGWVEAVYHAPSLDSGPGYPARWPGWLRWAWRAGWLANKPWQVQYPHQWFWDSVAHAVALSHLDPELARQEVRSLLYAQQEDGFIPHLIWNHSRMHWVDRLLQVFYPSTDGSPYLQTPGLAEAVEVIYERTSDIGFVKGVLPYLERYYQYLARERDRDGDGLPQIIHSYESGMDRSPQYDPVYGEDNIGPAWRGPMTRLTIRQRALGWNLDRIFRQDLFAVKDLLFDCVYAQNLAALARLFEAAGEHEQAELWRGRSQKSEEAILTRMYDPETGLFFSLDARGQKDQQLKAVTVASLFPLMLDSIPESRVERLVHDYLANPEEFWAPYPVPAEPLSTGNREAGGHEIWRGRQTFVYANWYLVRGLRKQAQRFPQHREEYIRLADQIALKTYELVREHGFWEYYDAETGEGRGAPHFGPSTLVLDMALASAPAP